MTFKLGLIGAGAIGADVIDLVAREHSGEIEIPAVLVRQPREPDGNGPNFTNDPEAFFSHQYDAVLEGAGHSAIIAHGARVLNAGSDLIVTSVGAFTDQAVYDGCLEAAQANGTRMLIASAGIGSLDILSGAAVGGLDEVVMTVRKDPSAWFGTVAEGQYDLANMTEPTVIFEGSPRAGAASYAQNVNISAAVSLAGAGLDRTKLIIVADPTIDTHVIEIVAKGAFGQYSFVENVAVSETNRKTGKIVAMAVMKTVRNLISPVVVGV